MARLPFTIDGVDFSGYVSKYGYKSSYINIEGGNGGVMQDGSTTVDILARKATIEATCNDMTADKLSAIMSACMSDYVTLTYYDLMTNADRTVECIPSVSSVSLKYISPGNDKWYSGLTITMVER